MHYMGIYIYIYTKNYCKNSFDMSERIAKLYEKVHFLTTHVDDNNVLVALQFWKSNAHLCCSLHFECYLY